MKTSLVIMLMMMMMMTTPLYHLDHGMVMVTLSRRNMTVREEPQSGFEAKARVVMGGGRRQRALMNAKLGEAVERSLPFQVCGASVWVVLSILGIYFGVTLHPQFFLSQAGSAVSREPS